MKIKSMLVSEEVRTKRSYSGANRKKSITIHNTDNYNKTSGARNHALLQRNLNKREASWHFQVDDKEIIQSFPLNSQCWHTGTRKGNQESIGIEICVNSGSVYSKAVENGARLTAKLLVDLGLKIKDVKQHYEWSRKDCPREIRRGKDGITWTDFLKMVEGFIKSEQGQTIVKPIENERKSLSQMAEEVIEGKHGNGHVQRQKSLGVRDSDYKIISRIVNEKLLKYNNDKEKTVKVMADEVIKGLHGNGHANRQKSLGITDKKYREVRALVNKLLK